MPWVRLNKQIVTLHFTPELGFGCLEPMLLGHLVEAIVLAFSLGDSTLCNAKVPAVWERMLWVEWLGRNSWSREPLSRKSINMAAIGGARDPAKAIYVK
jgi:hypothetical protein